MTRQKRDLTGDERRLWARVAKTVRSRKVLPIVEEAPVAAKTPAKKDPAKAPKRAASPKAAPPKKTVSIADRGGERRVKRGQVEIAARLDLHGYTQDGARAALIRFLEAAPAPSTVLVITGKGRGGEEGVLHRRFSDWLASVQIRDLISGYAQAHARHGGGGAFYIFVRRS